MSINGTYYYGTSAHETFLQNEIYVKLIIIETYKNFMSQIILFSKTQWWSLNSLSFNIFHYHQNSINYDDNYFKLN